MGSNDAIGSENFILTAELDMEHSLIIGEIESAISGTKKTNELVLYFSNWFSISMEISSSLLLKSCVK